MGGVALRIKATARPLCSAGTGDREPGLPTPDCAKSAVRPLGPVLGLRAAPLPARGKISWSDIARQSLRAGQRWGPAHRRRRLSVGGVSSPPRPPRALGWSLLGRSPLGAGWRGRTGRAISGPLQGCTQSPQRTPGRCAGRRTATTSAQTGCCAPSGNRHGSARINASTLLQGPPCPHSHL